MDYKVILSSRFVCNNNLIFQLGAKIFIIYKKSINKYKELSSGKINKHVEQSLIKVVYLPGKTFIQGKNIILSWFLVLSSNREIKRSLRLIDRSNISSIGALLHVSLLQRINVNNVNLLALTLLAQSNEILIQGEDTSIKE